MVEAPDQAEKAQTASAARAPQNRSAGPIHDVETAQSFDDKATHD